MVPLVIDVDGEVFDRTLQIPTAQTAELIELPTDLADFDVLYVESDKEVLLELVTDLGGEVGLKVYAITIAAGGSFVLTSDVSYAGYDLGEFHTADADAIENVSVSNESGETATVRILAIT